MKSSLFAFLFPLVCTGVVYLQPEIALAESSEASGDKIKYQLEAELDSTLRQLTARAEVNYTHDFEQAISELVFQLPPNAPFLVDNSNYLLSISRVSVDGKEVSKSAPGFILTVPLGRSLKKGETVAVQLEFSLALPKRLTASTMASDALLTMIKSLSGGETKSPARELYANSAEVSSFSHWYPIIPAFDGKSFDTSLPSGMGDIANFPVADYNLSLTADADSTVISSAELKSEGSAGEGKKRRIFEGKKLRELALLAGDTYHLRSKDVDGVKVNVYYLPKSKDKAEDMLKYASDSLAYFSKTFSPYPFPKLDVVEVPLGSGIGGMEYAGLIAVSSQFIAGMDFSKDEVLSLFTQDLQQKPDLMQGPLKYTLEFIIAHEVAHQWWHALVGNNSKATPFVDEALTNYSSLMYFENRYGAKVAAEQQYMQTEFAYQAYRLSGGADRKVDAPAESFSSPTEYAAIVYGKGPLYFKELRGKLGDELFLRVIRKYIEDYSFKIATPRSFPDTVTAVLKSENSSIPAAEVDALAKRWFEGTSGDADIGTLSAVKFVETFLDPTAFSGEDGLAVKLALTLFEKPLIKALSEHLAAASEGEAGALKELKIKGSRPFGSGGQGESMESAL